MPDWQNTLQLSTKLNAYLFGWVVRAIYLLALILVTGYLLINRETLQTHSFVYLQIGFEMANMILLCIIVFWLPQLSEAFKDKPQVMNTLWNASYFFWLMGHWVFVS